MCGRCACATAASLFRNARPTELASLGNSLDCDDERECFGEHPVPERPPPLVEAAGETPHAGVSGDDLAGRDPRAADAVQIVEQGGYVTPR